MTASELIKISELAARAGVEKSTIQHYLREGLLPVPDKRPHRNMHYYRADLVGRIKLIRELQSRRNLPLAKIRQVLADEHVVDDHGIEQIRAYLSASPSALDLARQKPLSRARLAAETGMEPALIDRLEERGFISPARKGTSVTYDAADIAIVHACQSMRAAGLGEQNGFGLEELAIYMTAMRELIGKELALFSRVLRKRSTEEIVEMARRGFEGTNTLLVGLRRKLFLQLLGEVQGRRGRRPR